MSIAVCVDHANDVWKELQRRQHGAATDGSALRAVTILDENPTAEDLEAV